MAFSLSGNKSNSKASSSEPTNSGGLSNYRFRQTDLSNGGYSPLRNYRFRKVDWKNYDSDPTPLLSDEEVGYTPRTVAPVATPDKKYEADWAGGIGYSALAGVTDYIYNLADWANSAVQGFSIDAKRAAGFLVENTIKNTGVDAKTAREAVATIMPEYTKYDKYEQRIVDDIGNSNSNILDKVSLVNDTKMSKQADIQAGVYKGHDSKIFDDTRQALRSGIGATVDDLRARADLEDESEIVKIAGTGFESLSYTAASVIPAGLGVFLNYAVGQQKAIKQKYAEMESRGDILDFDKSRNAYLYASGAALIEAGSEMIFPAAGLLTKASVQTAKQLLKQPMKSAILHLATWALKQGGQEGFEEIVSGFGQGTLAKLTTDPDATWLGIAEDSALVTLEGLGKQGLGGFMMGTVFSSIGGVKEYKNFKNSQAFYQQVKDIPIEDLTKQLQDKGLEAVLLDLKNKDNKLTVQKESLKAVVNIESNMPISKQLKLQENVLRDIQDDVTSNKTPAQIKSYEKVLTAQKEIVRNLKAEEQKLAGVGAIYTQEQLTEKIAGYKIGLAGLKQDLVNASPEAKVFIQQNIADVKATLKDLQAQLTSAPVVEPITAPVAKSATTPPAPTTIKGTITKKQKATRKTFKNITATAAPKAPVVIPVKEQAKAVETPPSATQTARKGRSKPKPAEPVKATAPVKEVVKEKVAEPVKETEKKPAPNYKSRPSIGDTVYVGDRKVTVVSTTDTQVKVRDAGGKVFLVNDADISLVPHVVAKHVEKKANRKKAEPVKAKETAPVVAKEEVKTEPKVVAPIVVEEFPVGSAVLVNGKVQTVTGFTPSKLQVKDDSGKATMVLKTDAVKAIRAEVPIKPEEQTITSKVFVTKPNKAAKKNIISEIDFDTAQKVMDKQGIDGKIQYVVQKDYSNLTTKQKTLVEFFNKVSGMTVVFYKINGTAGKKARGLFLQAMPDHIFVSMDTELIDAIGHEFMHSMQLKGYDNEFREATFKALMKQGYKISTHAERVATYIKITGFPVKYAESLKETTLTNELLAIVSGEIMHDKSFWDTFINRLNSKSNQELDPKKRSEIKNAISKIIEWLKEIRAKITGTAEQINSLIDLIEKSYDESIERDVIEKEVVRPVKTLNKKPVDLSGTPPVVTKQTPQNMYSAFEMSSLPDNLGKAFITTEQSKYDYFNEKSKTYNLRTLVTLEREIKDQMFSIEDADVLKVLGDKKTIVRNIINKVRENPNYKAAVVKQKIPVNQREKIIAQAKVDALFNVTQNTYGDDFPEVSFLVEDGQVYNGSSNPDVKERMEKNSKFEGGDMSIGAKAKTAREFITKTFLRGSIPELSLKDYTDPSGNRKNFGDIRRRIQQIREKFQITNTLVNAEISNFYNQMNPKEYKLLSEAVVVRDIMEDIKMGKYNKNAINGAEAGLIANIYNSTLDVYQHWAEIQAHIESSAYNDGKSNVPLRDCKITKLMLQRKQILDQYREKLSIVGKKVGYDPTQFFSHHEYMYHAVKQYNESAPEVKSKIAGNRLGDYKKRAGTDLAYITDAALADHLIMAKYMTDIMKMELLESIQKHDIKNDLPLDDQGHAYIPDGYTATTSAVMNMNLPQDYFNATQVDMAKMMVSELGLEGKDAALFVNAAKVNEMVVPTNVILAMQTLFGKTKISPVAKFFAGVQHAWKMMMIKFWTKALGYQARNFAGDIDGLLATYPAVFNKKYIGRAAQHLYEFYKNGKVIGESMLDEDGNPVLDANGEPKMKTYMYDYIWQGGLATGMSNVELEDFRKISNFKWYEAGAPVAKEQIKNVFKKLDTNYEHIIAFREQLLRYATYLYMMDQELNNTYSLPSAYGASIPSEIQGIDSVVGRAYKLSNDALGAYNDVSDFGTTVAKAIPFFRWREISVKRYFRILRNVFYNDPAVIAGVGNAMATKLGFTETGTRAKRLGKFTIYKLGKTALSMSLYTMAIAMVNGIMFPDEEKLLPDYVKEQPHINFGIWGGKMYYFNGVGSLLDVLNFFGFDNVDGDIQDVISGRYTLEDKLLEIAGTSVESTIASLNPIESGIQSLITGKKLFPAGADIKDPMDQIFSIVGFGKEYRFLAQTPDRGLGALVGGYSGIANATVDEQVYWNAVTLKNDYYRYLGIVPPSGGTSAKADAIYNYKLAIRLGDNQAALTYLAKYIEAGGTKDTMTKSLEWLSPLAGMKDEDKIGFKQWLTSEEVETVKTGIEYYKKLANASLDFATSNASSVVK